MIPTKHGTTNYKMLRPFLDALDARADCGTAWLRFTAPGFMDLSMEKLGFVDYRGLPVYCVAHYGEQNGDLMSDPYMEFSVDAASGRVEPLSFRNDFAGLYQEVYKKRGEKTLYSPALRTELDGFLWQWLKNIREQGFTSENRKEC